MPAADYAYSNLPFALSCAVDVAVGLSALTWAARSRPPYRRLALAAVAVTCLLVAKAVVMVASGLNQFGLIHVLWLDLVVVAPILGLAVLATSVIRRARPLMVVAVFALLLAPLGVYASYVEPSRTVLEKTTVATRPERAGSRPIRIAVLADLQFDRLGAHERDAIDLLMTQHPDVILVSGDIHQGTRAGFSRQLGATRRLFGRLRAPGGVYAVQGDAEGVPKARQAYAGTRVRLLVNEVVSRRMADRRLTIAGLQLRFGSEAARATARRLERAKSPADIRILLAHRPDAVLDLAHRTRVDLTVAGHTHGGQVQIPGLGALMTASKLPARIGSGGLHDLGARRIYVSRGIGVERGQAPRVRIGTPPEISLLTLR